MSISTTAREAFNQLFAWMKKAPWESRFNSFLEETLTEIADIEAL